MPDRILYIAVYFAAVSLLAVGLTLYDKHAAVRGTWRVRERTLMLAALAGGSAAMFATMRIIRHKTRHVKFMIGIPVIIALQIAAAVLLLLAVGDNMLGHFGFSYIGLIYMLMLQIPNIMWAKRKPKGYDPSGENKILLIFERIGQVLCSASILLFTDYNPHALDPWSAWLIVSAALMLLYEINWIRYFRSKLTVTDFYRPFLGIPAPGATLPVIAFLLLGIYGKVIWLILSSIILGIGHIGIHMQHIRALKQSGDSGGGKT